MAGVAHSTFASLTPPLSARLTAPQVLEELAGDQALEKFREEYEKLHRALKKSHGGSANAGIAGKGLGRSEPQ